MKVFIFLLLLAFTQTRIIDQKCDGIVVRNLNHEKEILKQNVSSPYQLAIDYDTNTLFFSYTANEEDDVFKSAYLNLKTNEYGVIKGIAGGFASAVDSNNNIVYLGGRDGIYKFDYDTKEAEHLGSDHNIWQMFYKNRLYYTRYPQEIAYSYKDGVSTVVEELNGTKVMLVALDNNQNIYFANSSGLFVYKRSKGNIDGLGSYILNAFSSDLFGNIYFSTPDGIYYIDENKKVIERLVTFNGASVYGVAAEGDGNIIYAAEDSIVRLKSTKTKCYTEETKVSYDQDNKL